MTPTAQDRGGNLSNPPSGGFFVLGLPTVHELWEDAYNVAVDMDTRLIQRDARSVSDLDHSYSADFSAPNADDASGFCSILFDGNSDNKQSDAISPPTFFPDLNCDQIVEALVIGRESYNLKPFFYMRLHDSDAVKYRQDIMRDLEGDALQRAVAAFSLNMAAIRDQISRTQKVYYAEQRDALFLDAVQDYCKSVQAFATELKQIPIRSNGFSAFRAYLTRYAASPSFCALVSETEKLKLELSSIVYSVQIRSNSFTVSNYKDEPDYSLEVEATFAKFKQDAAQDYRVQFRATDDLNHIEAKILEFVAKLFPKIFAAVNDFGRRHSEFLNATIARFDREVQFYNAYLGYIADLRAAGLSFCYPTVSQSSKTITATDCFDLALAKKLVREHMPIVYNDFALHEGERILVVSGPNQGGKTTFARMFGQIHYLASIGCPVPGRSATLFLPDQILTHFEKEEKVENHRGKLEDDLVRARAIVRDASAHSIIVMNEIFTSTTIQDELFLSKKLIAKIVSLDLLCVWVTFADELATFGPSVVSMVSTVQPDNPALRTFKVVRRPADGLAYAIAIAQKYRLTYDIIRDRMTR